MLFGRDLRVEFRTDSIGPPAAARLRTDDQQAMPLEFVGKRRLVGQLLFVHAMQVNHGVPFGVTLRAGERFRTDDRQPFPGSRA